MRRLLTLFLCLLPVVASAQTGTVISGDQVMVGGRRLTDALALKADAAPLAAALLSKADRSATTATAANKVDLSTFTSALAGKVDVGTYTAGLSTKADQAAVTSALAAKADASAMATALGLKANSTDVATSISSAVAPLAPLASPIFTGVPKAPTPSAGDSSAKVATTSFVGSAVSAGTAGLAPAASPALTGVPTAPTAAAGTSTTQIATTGFVTGAIGTAPLAPLASPSFTGTPTVPTAAAGTATTQTASTAFVGSAVSGLAPAASLTFTGVPAVPTAALGTNSTQAASTAFVNTFVDGRRLSSFATPGATYCNGTVDDTAMLKAAIAWQLAGGGRLYGDGPLKVCRFTSQLVMNQGQDIDWGNTILRPDTSIITSGAAAVMTGCGTGNKTQMRNLRMLGPQTNNSGASTPSNASAVDGLEITGTSSCYNSDGFFENLDIRGFRNNLVIDGANNYIHSVINPTLLSAWQSNVLFAVGTNSGENIRFFGGAVANARNSTNSASPGSDQYLAAGVTISAANGTSGVDAYFLGTSFDYNDQAGVLNGGQVSCMPCHMEDNTQNATWVLNYVAGQEYPSLRLVGGSLAAGPGGTSLGNAEYNGTSTTPRLAFIKANATGGHYRVVVDNVRWGPKQNSLLFVATDRVYGQTTLLPQVTFTAATAPRISEFGLIYNQQFNSIVAGTPPTVPGWALTSGTPLFTQPLAGSTQSATATWSSDTTIKTNASQSIKAVASSASNDVLYQNIPSIRTGDMLFIRPNLETQNQTAGKAGVYVAWYAQDGTLISTNIVQEFAGSNNALAIGAAVVTAPTGTVMAQVQCKLTGFIGQANWSTVEGWKTSTVGFGYDLPKLPAAANDNDAERLAA